MSSSSIDASKAVEKQVAEATKAMEDAALTAASTQQIKAPPTLSPEMLALLQRQMGLTAEQQLRQQRREMKGKEDLTVEHKFWNTQVSNSIC